MLRRQICRGAVAGLALVALSGCGAWGGASHDDKPPSTVGSQPVSNTSTSSFVASVNARCVELDRTKTAIYRDALADNTLTIPEYLLAESAYLPEARRFDADVAKIGVTAADSAARSALTAYVAWVETRRRDLDALAAKGDEAAFEAGLEQSNTGFFESGPVQQMKSAGFVQACLSR